MKHEVKSKFCVSECYQYDFGKLIKQINKEKFMCYQSSIDTNASFHVFLQLILEMAAAHFDAQLSPGPHVSLGSPELSLVQGAHKVGHNLYEVL